MIGVLASALFMSGCGGDPPVVGDMTSRNICETSGYLIRQQLGNGFRTVHHECHVTSLGGGGVQIDSGYTSPLGPSLRYTARGSVSGRTLTMRDIRVHGVDEDFFPFRELGR